MELTSYEKDILAGKYGEGMAYALEIQLAIGNAFDADRFVPITRTHVALSAQDADLWFAEKMLSKGAKCIIPPTVNPRINLNPQGGQGDRQRHQRGLSQAGRPADL